MQHLDEELQAEVVEQDVADGDHEIPDNLRPAFQRGARETDVTCHPEAREERDGELEDEGRDVGRESDEAKVEDLFAKDKMIEHVIQHPLQDQIQAAAGAIAEQLEAHYLAERRIEKVDDLGKGTLYPGFYVFQYRQAIGV